jgi:hypothetical protein
MSIVNATAPNVTSFSKKPFLKKRKISDAFLESSDPFGDLDYQTHQSIRQDYLKDHPLTKVEDAFFGVMEIPTPDGFDEFATFKKSMANPERASKKLKSIPEESDFEEEDAFDLNPTSSFVPLSINSRIEYYKQLIKLILNLQASDVAEITRDLMKGLLKLQSEPDLTETQHQSVTELLRYF